MSRKDLLLKEKIKADNFLGGGSGFYPCLCRGGFKISRGGGTRTSKNAAKRFIVEGKD